jgi:sigma-E factor negative regulatory protein RseB
VLLAVAAEGSADQFAEARQWLERMASAMSGQSYEGTFVYVRGEDVETIRLTHLLEDGVIQERLVALSGPPREVVRDPDGQLAVNSGQDSAPQPAPVAGSFIPDFSGASLERARGHYVFEVGGEGRIAGHRGRKLTITPRDQYRYGYELWLENHTGLPLRWVLYDLDRRALAKLMFTELVIEDATGPAEPSVGPLPSGAPPTGADEKPGDVAPSPESRLEGQLTLPPGFTIVAHGRDPANPRSEHLVLSDGLASLSVYLEPADDGSGLPEGLSRVGTTNAWSRRAQARRITAVGEVPPETLKDIGRSFLRLELAD